MNVSGSTALVPAWLGVVGTAVFALVAVIHLRHLRAAEGQRRPWHACHVLMAAVMIGMYAPGADTALPWLSGTSETVVALAGLLAAGWALWGGGGGLNPVWLLTALDLGAMTTMFSRVNPVLGWAAAVYLSAGAVLWALDAVRSVDRSGWVLLDWLPSSDGGALSATRVRQPGVAGGLLGDLDISPSMVLMCLGMATMAVTMRLGA